MRACACVRACVRVCMCVSHEVERGGGPLEELEGGGVGMV